ncbi:MAG: MFS transporter [Bacteroidales bacterium]|nr:MFS transporter [Bacteroidales bacterium]
MSKTKKILQKVNPLYNNSKHIWQFSRVGGVNRVNLESGSDLSFLDQLDQKLWTALSCPTHGLEIDSKTLSLIDFDKDERIRVPEILAAVKWITSIIKNPDDLLKMSPTLPLDAINIDCEEGKILLDSAKQILLNLGKTEQSFISVEETSDTEKIFAGTQFNGDGIITDNVTEDELIQKLINNIIETIGSATDMNGKAGISTEHIEEFYTQCQAYSDWYAKAEADKQSIMPYGDQSEEAHKAYLLIKPKIDDYFMRCRLAEFDTESIQALNSLNAQYEEISKKNLSLCLDEIAAFPLCKIEAKKPLSLFTGINPAWKDALDTFCRLTILSEHPKQQDLTEADWNKLQNKFTAYEAWQAEKDGNRVESLGLDYIRQQLNNAMKETLLAYIEEDKKLASNTDNIILVDKLTRYYRDLFLLLKNYVTFYDFYAPGEKAIFQAGSLYIDQRCCDLCIKVSDMNKHNLIAKTSAICLIYCDCTARTKKGKMTIVAALTDGDFDNIEVGRNALFYDREGDDWDATIVKVIENPISIKQAFWSPYRKFSRFISNQIEKFASSKEKEVESAGTAKIEAASVKAEDGLVKAAESKPAAAAPTPPPTPFDIGKFVGIFAALSLALGAIGSVLASFFTGFFGLKWWQMPLAILGIILCISGPSMILAWLKLRKRNLAPILDANGWAINARATINIIFGKTLTQLASLPENAKLNLSDPFAKKKRPFIPILIISFLLFGFALYLLWYYRILNF